MKRYSDNRKEYLSRINRAMDYIQNNLGNSLSLKEIAEVSNFSPYHFHRVFKSAVGETLNCFINRLRIEKSASMLLSKKNLSITEIAYDCGFSSSSAFARSFKDKYGMSASDYRGGGHAVNNKIRKSKSKNSENESKNGKETGNSNLYDGKAINRNSGEKLSLQLQTARRKKMSKVKPLKVTVQELPEMCMAYVRHIGPYKGDDALFRGLYEKIMRWAGPRGFLSGPEVKFLSVYHDDPEITESDKLRVSVGLTVPPETEVEGEIGKMTIPSGKYVLANFEIDQNQYQDAWDNVFADWFPKSGYICDDRPCFEWALNDPDSHPEKKHVINICVPVKPM
ncbi:AraC family transcriptional regulator [candidate division WOR-3 bacterium]|nr:AraC family transcriptional regulator [candidate division WOR-3 bacterium]